MVDDHAFDSDVSGKQEAGQPPPFDNYGKYVEEEIDEDDDYNDVDDYEDDDYDDDGEGEGDDLSLELGCPFCLEDYDSLGLCLHIQDQHPFETKSGVCPICTANAGRDMVSHLIIQHETMLKAIHKLRSNKSSSIMSLITKKLLDEHQRCRKASSTTVSSINVAPDPLLLSFINNPPHAHKPEVALCKPSIGPSLSAKSSNEITIERSIPSPPLLQNDQGEEAKKCDFVRTLLFSTIFNDDL